MLYIPSALYQCSQCHCLKLFSEFQRDKSRKHGVRSRCKLCIKNDRLVNRDAFVAKSRKRYRDNPERGRAYSKRWRIKNPQKQKAYGRKWQLQNAQKANDIMKRYRSRHPDKMRNNNQKRKAKLRHLEATFHAFDWKFSVNWWNGVCAYCGNPPGLFDVYPTLQQDHFIPLALNGSYTRDNILPACQTCNISKGNRIPGEWIAERFGPRKAKKILTRIADYFEQVSTR